MKDDFVALIFYVISILIFIGLGVFISSHFFQFDSFGKLMLFIKGPIALYLFSIMLVCLFMARVIDLLYQIKEK